MRLLFDENMSPDAAVILTVLGHPSEHVVDVAGPGTPDEVLAERMITYDALVTLDLHRQQRERRAMNEAIVSGGNLIRIRFKRGEANDVMAEVRALIWRWSQIQRLVRNEPAVGLLTITQQGARIRETTRAVVGQWLAEGT